MSTPVHRAVKPSAPASGRPSDSRIARPFRSTANLSFAGGSVKLRLGTIVGTGAFHSLPAGENAVIGPRSSGHELPLAPFTAPSNPVPVRLVNVAKAPPVGCGHMK